MVSHPLTILDPQRWKFLYVLDASPLKSPAQFLAKDPPLFGRPFTRRDDRKTITRTEKKKTPRTIDARATPKKISERG
jgi:hypothetical protein